MSIDFDNGYVKNKSHLGSHIMKRYVAPNGKIPLEELYEQYGERYSLDKDEGFIQWLKDVKLRDKSKWGIVFEEKQPEGPKLSRGDEGNEVVEKAPNKLQVEELADLSVRKAKDLVPNITDVKLLKYTLREASQRPQRKSLCDILRKRITDLETLGVTS